MLKTQQIIGDRYELLEQYGNNSGRQTWLAQDLQLEQKVILKLLAFNPQMQWDDFKLFEREAEVLKEIKHPNIPLYQDYFSLDQKEGKGLCWFVLVQEYITGKTLQQLLEAGRKFSEDQLKIIAFQVLEILIYLHQQKPQILHRDLKPSNLILGENNEIYLVDFGAVQNSANMEGATFTVVGTTGYAPLEQFWGKAVPASDLYALGATLIHLLTGINPANLPQKNLKIKFQDYVSIQSSFMSWLEALIQPDLNLRFKSAQEALIALEKGKYINYPLTKVQPYFNTKIQIQKSPSELQIYIPGKGLGILRYMLEKIALWLYEFGYNFGMVSIGCYTLILIMTIIGMIISLFIVPHPLSIVAIIVSAIFLKLAFFVSQKGRQETEEITKNIKGKKLPNFGDYILKLNLKYLTLEHHKYGFSYFKIKAPLTNIQEIQQSNTKNIKLKTIKGDYFIAKNVKKFEADWLFQEITNWLSEL